MTANVRALACCGDVAFIAGKPLAGGKEPRIEWADARNPVVVTDVPEDEAAGAPTASQLWAFSLADGRLLHTLPLAHAPAWDGLAAGGGRLYLSTADGRLLCFGAE